MQMILLRFRLLLVGPGSGSLGVGGDACHIKRCRPEPVVGPAAAARDGEGARTNHTISSPAHSATGSKLGPF